MEIAGYIASAIIGISMGLIGGGGSILTIPILVYLFGMSPTISISYSLFIVGFSSLVGAINNYRRGLVDFKTVLLFGSSSVTTVFISRRFIIPNLPDVFFRIGSFTVTHGLFVMVVFAILMLAASISMIRSKKVEGDGRTKQNKFVLIIYGVLIGLVTGFLGAGGGFLLVPALVLLMKLPMKEAIGTSLFIIAMNSLIGFTGDIGRHEIHWQFLLTVTAIAVGGVFIGIYFNKQIDAQKLKKGFGWFVLAMAIYVITREMFFSPHAEKTVSTSSIAEPPVSLKSWKGGYVYDEPPVQGTGSTMMMQWQIKIDEDSAGSFADIEIDGWQTYTSLQARVAGNENEAALLFSKHRKVNLEQFDVGDTLLLLRRQGDKIITQWKAFQPRLSDDPPKECACFERYRYADTTVKYSDWNAFRLAFMDAVHKKDKRAIRQLTKFPVLMNAELMDEIEFEHMMVYAVFEIKSLENGPSADSVHYGSAPGIHLKFVKVNGAFKLIEIQTPG